MNDISIKLNDKAQTISISLIECVEKYTSLVGDEGKAKIVRDAMIYSLSAGGKRLRPILTVEFYKLFGGKEDITELACAIEMIHTFSLIHDDLPCMDNDDFRRGRKSCHKEYDEAIALLAGDALAVLPYEIISDQSVNGKLSSDKALKLIRLLSSATGVRGMIGGQVLDMMGENQTLTQSDLELLQSKKTGALIEAACLAGCILCGASDEQQKNAGIYANKLGAAFQVCDDILDITGSFEELGKPIGSDALQGKSTFAVLLGVEKAREYAMKLTDEAVESIKKYDGSDFLIDLAYMLNTRKS